MRQIWLQPCPGTIGFRQLKQTSDEVAPKPQWHTTERQRSFASDKEESFRLLSRTIHREVFMESRSMRAAERISQLFAGIAVILLAACSHVPYKNMTYLDKTAACTAVFEQRWPQENLNFADLSDAERRCYASSYEYTTDTDLLIAEFDDQGWIPADAAMNASSSTDELDRLFQRFARIREKYCNDISLVLFIHGWHHNAGPEDTNLRDFRHLLTTLSANEQRSSVTQPTCPGLAAPLTGRHVVGIYVGWAGESINVPGIKYTTVEDRKLTAQKVAQGSVRELLARLTLLRERYGRPDKKDPHQGSGMRMLSIGHSFGGLILFESLQQALIKDAVPLGERSKGQSDDIRYANRQGDLVVLVNPAFEATRYEALRRAAERVGEFAPDQYPVFISVTSNGDIWTGKVFSAFRSISTFLEKTNEGSEREANRSTIGHNDRYITHDLQVCPKNEGANCKPDVCVHGSGPPPPTGFSTFGQRTVICELSLTARAKFAQTHNPYWVVQTNDLIVQGHDGFFNKNFESFVTEMYTIVDDRKSRTR